MVIFRDFIGAFDDLSGRKIVVKITTFRDCLLTSYIFMWYNIDMKPSDNLQNASSRFFLEEERRRYSDLNQDMADGKNRILALLSVEFVLMAYLFRI